MRPRSIVLMFLLFLPVPLFARDVYLSIGGQVNNFFTDARILNPSFDKDITITARYLQNNSDNSGVPAVTITVPKRTMAVYDNVVSSLFNGSGIGAVRLTSDDDFVATQRIYARVADQTLGQFVPGLDASTALTKGALIQLKQTGTNGSTFRTNLGGVNPNGVAANVTLRLYDKPGAVVATRALRLEPYGVLTPQRVDGFFNGSTADLSDAWVSFESDQPIFFYGSIVDNASTDPTFITASPDSGVAPVTPPPAPDAKTVTITAHNWFYTVTGASNLSVGDKVKLVISSPDAQHGFQLQAPSGATIIPMIDPITSTPVERTFTITEEGTYIYFCTHSSCGAGHVTMNGAFDVGKGGGNNPGDPY